nr:MAG TPA: hypothetical protein [Caudoviricetes sp.]
MISFYFYIHFFSYYIICFNVLIVYNNLFLFSTFKSYYIINIICKKDLN